jgi:hypothetical protein
LKSTILDVGAFWKRTLERAKTGPTFVTIRRFGGLDFELDILETLRFDLLPRMQHLTIQLKNTDAAERLVEAFINLPAEGVIEHLELTHSPPRSSQSQSQSQSQLQPQLQTPLQLDFPATSPKKSRNQGADPRFPYFSVDVGSVVTTFPGIHTLTISHIPGLSFACENVIRSVKQIKISNGLQLSLPALARTFPNVETLEIYDTALRSHRNSSILLPRLRSLSVQEVKNMPWASIRAPKIKRLSFMEQDPGITTFISNHSSLKRIDMVNSSIHILDLPELVPRLESLGIEPRELFDTFDTRVSAKTGSKRNSRDSPPCPIQLDNLLDLALYQFDQDDLSIEAFEAIVRDRLPSIPTYTNKGIDGLISPCVSRSNAKHTSQHAKSTMGTLKILVLDSISTRQLEWRASELLSHAVEEVSIVERWNKRFRSYSLRWK